MQMNPSTGSNSIAYNHLFQDNRKSNRLELIADFTENVDVEIIASLKVSILLLSKTHSGCEYHTQGMTGHRQNWRSDF